MIAIILCAGQGTRLKPITDEIPKSMVKINNKPILEHIVEKIYEEVNEIIFVVGYKKETIISYFGDNFRGTKITYHNQGEKKGTAGAVIGIKSREDILLIYGDSIFEKRDLDKVIKLNSYGCLVLEVKNPEKYGVWKQDKDGFALEVVEKPSEFIGNLANLGVYKFSPNILDFLDKIELSKRGEYELTDCINLFLKENKFRLFKIDGDFIDVSYPEDIKKAEEKIRNQILKKPEIGKSVLLEDFGDFELHLGIIEKEINNLVKYSTNSQDKALLENTSDLKRFSTRENFEKWYSDENRYTFSLLTKDGDLAGIWWARPAKLPGIKEIIDNELVEEILNNKDFVHTSGIRIYPDFRGKGLAKIILQSSKFYRKLFPNAFICIDIDKQNIASQKSYERAGYKFFGYGENKKTVEAVENPRMLYLEEPF